MHRALVGFITLTLVAASACSNDLERSGAAEILEEHLVSLAPAVIHPDSFRVTVDQILVPDQNNRQVRFRLIWLAVDSAGKVVRDTSKATYTAYVRRSADGWALGRYGKSFKPVVAAVVAAQRRSLFDHLIEALQPIEEVASDWSQRWSSAFMDGIEAISEGNSATPAQDMAEAMASSDSADAGIPTEELKRRVQARSIDLPDSIYWGIAGERGPENSRVLWIRSRADTSVVCARELGSGYGVTGYYWMGDVGVSCRGYGIRYNSWQARENALKRIADAGGILLTGN